ncbi:MAG: Flp pilus assembly complex ATPase component TadA [Candidatus Eremiobacteraeota bacterium]|nr:Flp pilus assembly complex ATPase component TadA [Candidatus Eremiobacteraeota bacterium]MBV8367091.1 Flp pilus assembly complex ATPase component TadA [Candidatus Eremiobacteraeota bacterium]
MAVTKGQAGKQAREAADAARPLLPELPKATRRFKRRRLRCSVTVKTDAGKAAIGEAVDVSGGGLRLDSRNELDVGDRGTAQIRVGSGETLRVPIEVAWRNQVDGAEFVYGLTFTDINASDRFALLEAIYAPEHGSTGFVDAAAGPDEEVQKAGSEPTSPAYYAYYMRLVRRIEQVKKLDPSDSDRILFARLMQGRPIRELLTELEIVERGTVEEFLGELYKVPFIDLVRHRPEITDVDVIPENLAVNHSVVPIERTDDALVVAMADPSDLLTIDMVRNRVKGPVELRFALLEDISTAIDNIYHGASLHSVDKLLESMPGSTESFGEGPGIEDLETLRRISDTAPIVTLVESLLRTSVEDRASDIHLEPYADKIAVRFRLDGVLRELRTLPKNIYPAVVSRIKIMSRMDITVRHVPQDGGMSMRYKRKEFDLRISSLPTLYGEKIVIRLLEKNPVFRSLRAIGFSERNYEIFSPLVKRPYGMILCCGPTGSGKSTTLFACLQEINDGTTNITTIEDPVEYRVGGVNQVEVSAKRGLTFASVLRALLRQDPDVIYVGEIRDRETADLAVRAALTGHLLLSTLHTNTAIQAIARLVDIGVDPAMIGSSILGCIGQRLMRRICDQCAEDYEVPLDEQMVLQELVPVATPKTLRRGRGCEKCHESGYYGRLGVHEIVAVDEGLRRLIARGADSTQLLDYVTSRGFTDLRDDALGRMLAGETTLREVLRVTA